MNKLNLGGAIFLASSLLVSPRTEASNDNSTMTATASAEMSQNVKNHRRNMVDLSSQQIVAIRSALTNYYAEKGGWPSSLNSLRTEGFYTGSFDTPYGTITGVQSGVQYGLTIVLPTGNQAASITKSIAAKSGGVASNNVFKIDVATPSTLAIASSMLCRKNDPANPNCSRMEQNLSLGGHSILDVLKIDADEVSTRVVNAVNINATEDLNIQRDANIVRHITIGGDQTTKGNVKVEKTFEVSGTSKFGAASEFSALATFLSGIKAGGTSELDKLLVNQTSQFNGAAEFKGVSTFQDSAVFNDVIFANKGIRVGAGQAIETDTIVVNGTATITEGIIDRLTVNQDMYAKGEGRFGTLQVDTDSEIGRDLFVRRNAQIDGMLTVTGVTTGGSIDSKGGFFANGSRVVSDDGSILYEDGEALAQRYLGINDKADDADLLDGKDSTAFAQRDETNTFSKANTFLQPVQINTAHGNLTIGSTSSGTQFVSNRPFYFSQKMDVQGDIGLYGKQTYLRYSDGAIVQNGMTLGQTYLGINAKAVDAEKLDGLDSSAFAQRSATNTFSGVNSFTRELNANGGVKVDGRWVISANGSTIYENGQALNARYLGKNAKAVDSDKLDGLDSTAFAQRNATNIFTGNNTFTRLLQVNGGISGKAATFTSVNSTGSITEQGTPLVQKYLGINAKAKDADKLDGVNSTQFARLDLDASFKRNVNVAGNVRASGDVYAYGSKSLSVAYNNAASALSKSASNASAIGTLNTWRINCARYGATDSRCNIGLPTTTEPTPSCTVNQTQTADTNERCPSNRKFCEPGYQRRTCGSSGEWGSWVVMSGPLCVNLNQYCP
ncbi:hypothetical protein [Shewanella sp. MBTL60-007]|uniref:hypothetical protein n=1 Tax=Shewanella sp. MBTL60-007 TaxID=2815911 RepID=UPI001BBAE6B7|nr:hypothetical protein [Shewanella sp. MBTL60-007]GIU20917.1 hypothetical protein TUM3792_21140 [Shewanella sp. MBTL60-007]